MIVVVPNEYSFTIIIIFVHLIVLVNFEIEIWRRPKIKIFKVDRLQIIVVAKKYIYVQGCH